MESPRVNLRNSQAHSLLILLQTIGNKMSFRGCRKCLAFNHVYTEGTGGESAMSVEKCASKGIHVGRNTGGQLGRNVVNALTHHVCTVTRKTRDKKKTHH